MILEGVLSAVESDLKLSVASCVETVFSLDGGVVELIRDGIVTEGLSGDEPLMLDSTGVMLQDSDTWCDIEDKLCDHSGSGVLTHRSLTSPPGVKHCLMSVRSGGWSGDTVDF